MCLAFFFVCVQYFKREWCVRDTPRLSWFCRIYTMGQTENPNRCSRRGKVFMLLLCILGKKRSFRGAGKKIRILQRSSLAQPGMGRQRGRPRSPEVPQRLHTLAYCRCASLVQKHFFLSLLFYFGWGGRGEKDAFEFTDSCHEILHTVEVGTEMIRLPSTQPPQIFLYFL